MSEVPCDICGDEEDHPSMIVCEACEHALAHAHELAAALREALAYTTCVHRPHRMPTPWMPLPLREHIEALLGGAAPKPLLTDDERFALASLRNGLHRWMLDNPPRPRLYGTPPENVPVEWFTSRDGVTEAHAALERLLRKGDA